MLTIASILLLCLGLTAQDKAGIGDIDIYNPMFIETISTPSQNLSSEATAQYQAGDYEKAARFYIGHLWDKPSDSSALYNLSCCYGLLGKDELAAKTLMMAYKAGFEDIEHIRQDPDFDKVKQSKIFSAAMDSLSAWSAIKAKVEGKMEYYAISTYLPYRIYLPDGFDESAKYNLLIGLHGFGDQAVPFGRIHQVIKDKPFIYIVPEAPYILPGNERPGFSWTPMVDYSDPLQEKSFMGLNTAIRELCQKLEKDYQIDKTFLMGFSQGCFMTYNIGLANPDLFDGLLAFGGWLSPEVIGESTIKKACKVKVFIAHGTTDRVIEFTSAEKSLQILKENNYQVELFSFEDGHRIDRKALLSGLTWLSEN